MKKATGFSGDWRRITVHEVQQARAEAHTRAGRSPMSRRRAARTRSTPSSIWRSRTGSTSAIVLAQFNVNEKLVADNLTDPGVLIALGDGGAHVDMLCDAGYPTYLLGTWVRERQIMTLEQAIRV